MKRKKITAILMASLMVLGCFTGCGKTEGQKTDTSGTEKEVETVTDAEEEKTTPESGGDVVLNMYLWDQSMLDGVERREAMVTQQFPNITFNNTVLSWNDYWTKLQTALPSDSSPDLFFSEANHTIAYGSKGFLELLDSYIERDSYDMGVFVDPAIDLFTSLDGEIYGLPQNIDHTALYYNKELFDAANVEYPKDDMTFEEFRELAKKLTVIEGDRVQQYGVIVGPQPQNAVYSLLLENGCYPYGEDRVSSNFSDPAMKETLELIRDMIFEDRSAPSVQDLVDESADQMFINGRSAMYVAAPASMDYFVEAMGTNFDVVSMPANKKAGVSIMGMGLCMSAKTKYKEECWEVMKIFGSKQAQEIEGEQLCPARQDAQEAFFEIFKNYNMEPFRRSADIGEVIIPKRNMGVADQAFQDMLGLIYAGEDLDEALAEADGKVAEALKE